MKNKHKCKIGYIILLTFNLLVVSCGGDSNKSSSDEVDATLKNIDEKARSDNEALSDFVKIKVGNSFYSIPSPIQTTHFLSKQEGVRYNADLINNTRNVVNYTTSFKKALNMGIYGTDLVYLMVYKNTDLCIKYLNKVRILASDLGLTGVFNDDLVNGFSENMGNQDSMLVFINQAYRDSDHYLKSNDKFNIATLVLVGGWVESIYFLTQMCEEDSNPKLMSRRIAEQKKGVSNIIQMLTSLGEEYNELEEYKNLVSQLNNLLQIFDEINYIYQYESPKTNPHKKETTIRCKNLIEISNQTVKKISNSVEEIRKSIIE